MVRGLPAGDFYFELLDPGTQLPKALFDLAWPDGLQQGLSQPVAVLLNEASETEETANQAGFLFFTDIESFKRYVERVILAQEMATD